MAGWLTSRLNWLANLKRWLEKVFRHEISIWLHRLNLVATILVFIHVWLIDNIRAITSFMILFTGATALVFLAYGYYRYQAHQGHTQAQLMEIKALNDQVLQLVIKLRRPLSLHSGDYIFIAFPEIAGLEELHPFSLAKIDSDRRVVTLVIRQDGDFTSQLAQLSNGQSLIVTGGYGLYHSIIQDQKPQAMILLAGGIGVVPLLSIAEQYADLPINFYYNAHSANNLLYEDLFAKWEQRDNFKAVRQVGRLATQEVINQLPDNRQGLLILIAGPSSMAHHWIRVLKAAGIPVTRFFTKPLIGKTKVRVGRKSSLLSLFWLWMLGLTMAITSAFIIIKHGAMTNTICTRARTPILTDHSIKTIAILFTHKLPRLVFNPNQATNNWKFGGLFHPFKIPNLPMQPTMEAWRNFRKAK